VLRNLSPKALPGLLRSLLGLRTGQVTAGAVVLGLVVATGAVLAAGPWDSTGQRTAERAWAAGHAREGGADHGAQGPQAGGHGAQHGSATIPSAPPVLLALGAGSGAGTAAASGHGASGTVPTEKSLGPVLDPLLADASLGRVRTAAVVDVASGRQVFGRAADRPQTPASTTKLATATAALSALGDDHRIETRVVLDDSPRKGHADVPRAVLVGGGDPTLTAHADAHGFASLRTLADSTARELKARHLTEIALGYDDSLYTGPRLHPIGRNDNLAPLTALTADEGRLDDSTEGPAPRTADPSGDAARAFAGFLRRDGIRIQGRPAAAKEPRGAEHLAAVWSPPLSDLVERMETNSDNDIAENLARQTALALHRPADFAGGAAAVAAQLAKLGLPVRGASFHDGSGLDRADRVTARLLTSVLAAAGAPAHPELRSVLTGLPVAGFTGTLASRYASGADAAGTGLVRAKTGTLTGVNTLAGTVVDTDGRLLAFAFMTSGGTSPTATEAALDHLAAALTRCGCG
jgi:D-alanyl-D-alanine carboxypeptidase/D-alanyl-D-alanine-endopeptidase (penicillin-binding protein 4)